MESLDISTPLEWEIFNLSKKHFFWKAYFMLYIIIKVKRKSVL